MAKGISMVTNDQTNLRKIFGEAFRRHGPPTTVPDDVGPSTLKTPYDPQNFFPGIYCDYVDTDELNAMACIYKGHELVALSRIKSRPRSMRQND